jgi:hypothetical protein
MTSSSAVSRVWEEFQEVLLEICQETDNTALPTHLYKENSVSTLYHQIHSFYKAE